MNTVEDRLRAALAAKSAAVSLDDYRVEVPAPDTLLALPDLYHPARQRWHAVVAAAVAAVVLIAVGVTLLAGHDRHTSHLAAAGRAGVPWSQVGPDWTLAVVPDSAAEPALDLISPAGVRYRICRLPAPFVALQPWVTSTGKAIVTGKGSEGPNGIEYDGKDVLIVDLRTGAQTRTSVSSTFSTIQFAGPGPDDLLVTYPSSMQLVSVSIRHTLARYPLEGPVLGSILSPDASQVVAGGSAGLVVFDRASGRRIRTLAAPAGYGACQALRWQPANGGVLARCFTRTGSLMDANFTFAADGRRPPQPDRVPTGWQEIRLATGSIAYQFAAPGKPGPLDVTFAAVDSTNRLTPLTAPAELEQGRWELAAVDANVLLFAKNGGALADPHLTLQVAAWNPLTGAFTSLIGGSDGPLSDLSYRSWQQYAPSLL